MSLNHRLSCHVCHSRRYDTPINRAIRKYGAENCQIEALKKVPVKKLDDTERYFIKKYNTLVPHGFNAASGGKRGFNIKLTQETKEKMPRNNARIWLGKLGAAHNCSKAVSQYDLEGNLIKTFGGQSEAARATGVDNSAIGKCCRREYGYKTAGGYNWKFA